MKLAKLLVHSIPAGALLALLLALLLFFLNPETELTAAALWRAWTILAAVYGLAAAVVWPLGLLALRFFAERRLELPWFRFRLFHRFHLINTFLAAALWWGNFLATPATLPEAARRLLLAGCGIVSLVWALGALLSLQRVMFRTPAARRVQAGLLVVLYGGLLVLRAPAGAPPPSPAGPATRREAPAERRLVLIAVEGLSPDLILPLAAEGKLPNFQRMMREGARARVQSFLPALPPAVWTSVATGVLPRRHGIVDFARFLVPPARFARAPRYMLFRRLIDLGLVGQRPVGGADRREPALWNILDAFGLPSAVIGWWATEGAEPAPGGPAPGGPSGEPAASVQQQLDRLADWGAGPGDDDGELQRIARGALERDLAALRQAARARAADRPVGLLVYLAGLDLVQHRFLGYAFDPALRLGGEPSHPVYGEVVARYYRFLDEALGGFLEPQGTEPQLLLVTSGFGVDRVPPWTLLLRDLAGHPGGEGYHDRAPAGILLAWGEGVAAGTEAAPARPTDILPTALYYLGLPVARDLDGRPRTDLFGAGFARQQPLTYVPSYQGVPSPAR